MLATHPGREKFGFGRWRRVRQRGSFGIDLKLCDGDGLTLINLSYGMFQTSIKSEVGHRWIDGVRHKSPPYLTVLWKLTKYKERFLTISHSAQIYGPGRRITKRPVWLARSKKCSKSLSPVKLWIPSTVSWKFQGTYLHAGMKKNPHQIRRHYWPQSCLWYIRLTFGWHQVPPCTSWAADPSSRSVGFGSSECCQRCTERAAHLSGNNCFYSLLWRISLTTTARQEHVLKVWQV